MKMGHKNWWTAPPTGRPPTLQPHLVEPDPDDTSNLILALINQVVTEGTRPFLEAGYTLNDIDMDMDMDNDMDVTFRLKDTP